jgi:hypothetical protein
MNRDAPVEPSREELIALIAAQAAEIAALRAHIAELERRLGLNSSNSGKPPSSERAPIAGVRYGGFTDPSGGSVDSFTLAVGHLENEIAILDCVREVRPPFSPEDVTREFCILLKSYRVTKIHGDRYAGEWPREQFRKFVITYESAEKPKSDLYRDLLPLINSGRADLLDDTRLIAQLAGLERRTARSGKDSIDHAPGGHDDVCNAAAGVLTHLVMKKSSYNLDGFFDDDKNAGVDPDFDDKTIADDYQAGRLQRYVSSGGRFR